MFHIFKKRNDLSNCTLNDAKQSFIDPSNVFLMLGPMKSFWDEFIEGENLAVDVFQQYSKFVFQLKNSYPNIEFNRTLNNTEDEYKSITLTSGECMYLKILNLNEDIYISLQGQSIKPTLLLKSQLQDMISKLNSQEVSYCNSIEKYIDGNIRSLVENVSYERYGTNICEHTLPINTYDCMQYHRYLTLQNQGDDDLQNQKWNRIYNAPIFDCEINENNPLVLININNIDVLILDYLCYGTISLPTVDWEKVIHFRDEKTEKNLMQIIVQKFGDGIDKYLDKAISDMNCLKFRNFVQSGLKIK